MAPKILNSFQQNFIKLLVKNRYFKDYFYLTGGTALAAYYLHHRYSEDLDFFSFKEIGLLELDTFLREVKAPLKITKTDFQQSFNRNIFFLHSKKLTIGNGEFSLQIKQNLSLIEYSSKLLFPAI